MKRARFLGLALGWVLFLAAVALGVHLTRTRVHVGNDSGERVPLDAVDHAGYDALLQKYVDDQGLVAYRRWKESTTDVQALDDYLGRLGRVDLQAPAAPAARLALWINAYNALTLKGILLRYPLGSIKDIVSHVPGGYNVWRDLLLRVDGKDYSLENIEHDILRHLNEPRIHFAIVCASKGCPPLRNRAYTAKDLDAQLTDNAQRFFARPTNFKADADDQAVHVSKLLEWYGSDFAPKPAEQIRRLRPYLPGQEKLDWISDPALLVVFDLEYDWALNEQPGGGK